MHTRRSKKSPLSFDPEVDKTFYKNRNLHRTSLMDSTLKTNESPMTSEPNQPPPVTTTTQNPPPSTSLPDPPPLPIPKAPISSPMRTDPVGGSEIPPKFATTRLNFNTYSTSQGQSPYPYQTQNPHEFTQHEYITPVAHTHGYTDGLVVDEGVEENYEDEQYEDDVGYEDLGDVDAPQAPQFTVIRNPTFQQPPVNLRRQQVVEPRQRVEVNFNDNGRNRFDAGRAMMQPRPAQNTYVPPPFPHRHVGPPQVIQVPRRAIQRQARGIEAHFKPIITHNPSPVVIPENRQGRTFEVRANSLQSLPKFHGIATEEPYFHLESYDSICNTIGLQGFSPDEVKLVLFQFSLEDKAKKWFHTLPSASIYTWADMQQIFLEEYFTAQKTSNARRNIRDFRQQVGESFHEAFDRLNMMLRQCPHHGIDLWELVSSFYEGLSSDDQRDLMSISNGTFGSNYEDIDWGYLEQQSITSKRMAQASRRSKLNVGRAQVNEVGTGKNLIDVCGVCNDLGHTTELCPNALEGENVDVNFVNSSGGFRGTNNFNTNMYQPGMRNHPNLRYGNAANQANPNFQGAQSSSYAPNHGNNYNNNSGFSSTDNEMMRMLKMMQQEMLKQHQMIDARYQKDEIKNDMRDKAIQSLTTQMGQMAKELSDLKKNKGQLPSDTQVNPYHSTTRNVEINQVSVVGNDSGTLSGSKGVKIPYPSALYDTGSTNFIYKNPVSQGKAWERVNKIGVNNPLIEKVKQEPEHLNVLKNLVTNKQKNKIPKQISLTSHVSSMIKGNLPTKLQDPGAPLIDIQIGDVKISNVLLDLGAGGNILPGAIYDKFDFGPLHRVDSKVVLNDLSTKAPRGMVKDVIVKVQDFFYPVDFLVVDYEVKDVTADPSVILGRPFLNTSHAIIDCQCGTVNLSFGGKRANLNVSPNLSNSFVCENDLDAGLVTHLKDLVKKWMEEMKTGASPG